VRSLKILVYLNIPPHSIMSMLKLNFSGSSDLANRYKTSFNSHTHVECNCNSYSNSTKLQHTFRLQNHGNSPVISDVQRYRKRRNALIAAAYSSSPVTTATCNCNSMNNNKPVNTTLNMSVHEVTGKVLSYSAISHEGLGDVGGSPYPGQHSVAGEGCGRPGVVCADGFVCADDGVCTKPSWFCDAEQKRCAMCGVAACEGISSRLLFESQDACNSRCTAPTRCKDGMCHLCTETQENPCPMNWADCNDASCAEYTKCNYQTGRCEVCNHTTDPSCTMFRDWRCDASCAEYSKCNYQTGKCDYCDHTTDPSCTTLSSDCSDASCAEYSKCNYQTGKCDYCDHTKDPSCTTLSSDCSDATCCKPIAITCSDTSNCCSGYCHPIYHICSAPPPPPITCYPLHHPCHQPLSPHPLPCCKGLICGNYSYGHCITPCTNRASCSDNGDCTNSVCTCDNGWTGDACNISS